MIWLSLETATPAAAVAVIVIAIAALAGFLGPYLVGWVKDVTGVFHYAPPILAIGPLMSALLLLRMRRQATTTSVTLSDRSTRHPD